MERDSMRTIGGTSVLLISALFAFSAYFHQQPLLAMLDRWPRPPAPHRSSADGMSRSIPKATTTAVGLRSPASLASYKAAW